MSTAFFQIVITVWMHGHALTYTMPQLYTATDEDACYERVQIIGKRLDRHVKRNVRFKVECAATDKRET